MQESDAIQVAAALIEAIASNRMPDSQVVHRAAMAVYEAEAQGEVKGPLAVLAAVVTGLVKSAEINPEQAASTLGALASAALQSPMMWDDQRQQTLVRVTNLCSELARQRLDDRMREPSPTIFQCALREFEIAGDGAGPSAEALCRINNGRQASPPCLPAAARLGSHRLFEMFQPDCAKIIDRFQSFEMLKSAPMSKARLEFVAARCSPQEQPT